MKADHIMANLALKIVAELKRDQGRRMLGSLAPEKGELPRLYYSVFNTIMYGLYKNPDVSLKEQEEKFCSIQGGYKK